MKLSSSSLTLLVLSAGVGVSSSTISSSSSSSSSIISCRSPKNGRVAFWGIVSRGGSEEAATSSTTTTVEEEPSLDERVMAAMNKLGISNSGETSITSDSSSSSSGSGSSSGSNDGMECKDGICTVPPAVETNKITEEEFRKEFEDLDDSIIFAALSATREVSTDNTNDDEVQWNYDAARILLQQELDAIKRITPDSPEVRTYSFCNTFLIHQLPFHNTNFQEFMTCSTMLSYYFNDMIGEGITIRRI